MVSKFAVNCITGVQFPVGTIMVIFFFVAVTSPALGPTHPPFQCVPGGKAAGVWSWPFTYV